jgi:hypothetical protein
MIARETFTINHINSLRVRKRINPPILERAIVALGLVEALSKAGLHFIFKGGSSLMLLLNKPMRLSTDCDILVEPNCPIEKYVGITSKIYPFLSYEESRRVSNKSIEKKHFRFKYKSLLRQDQEVTILLDIVFCNNPYSELITKEIKSSFLITNGKNLSVIMPSSNAIIGDKLTAFAPHTIGVKFYNDDFSNDKRLEVIKQFYDVSTLFEYATDFNAIKENYISVAKEEIRFRNLSITYEDCLKDSFLSSLSIISRGKIDKEDYLNLLDGIRKIKDHIFGESFSAEKAVVHSANVLLLVSGILSGEDILKASIPNFGNFIDGPYKSLNYLNCPKLKSTFNKAAYAIKLFENYSRKP